MSRKVILGLLFRPIQLDSTGWTIDFFQFAHSPHYCFVHVLKTFVLLYNETRIPIWKIFMHIKHHTSMIDPILVINCVWQSVGMPTCRKEQQYTWKQFYNAKKTHAQWMCHLFFAYVFKNMFHTSSEWDSHVPYLKTSKNTLKIPVWAVSFDMSGPVQFLIFVFIMNRNSSIEFN